MTLGPGKIVGFFFTVAAIVACYTIVNHARLAARMRPVTGVLESIDYDHSKVGTSRASTYNIKVRFSYPVNGATYTGHLVSLRGNFYSSESEAQAVLSRFGNPGQLTVWYDPAAPSFAVLQKPEVEARSWLILLGLVAASLCCYLFLDNLVLGLRGVTRK